MRMSCETAPARYWNPLFWAGSQTGFVLGLFACWFMESLTGNHNSIRCLNSQCLFLLLACLYTFNSRRYTYRRRSSSGRCCDSSTRASARVCGRISATCCVWRDVSLYCDLTARDGYSWGRYEDEVYVAVLQNDVVDFGCCISFYWECGN